MTDADFFRTVGSATEQAVDTAVGSGAVALDVIRRPQRSRRRGAQATDQALRDAGDLVDDALALPERLVLGYLRGVRRRARRRDVLGLVSRGLLSAVNRPAGTAAGFFDRVERVTEVATRSRRRPSAPGTAGKAGRAVTSAARRTKSGATTTRRRNATGRSTSARRGGGSARGRRSA